MTKTERIERLENSRESHQDQIFDLQERVAALEDRLPHEPVWRVTPDGMDALDIGHEPERITAAEAYRRAYEHVAKVEAGLLREAERDARESSFQDDGVTEHVREDVTAKMLQALEAALGYRMRQPDETRHFWRWMDDETDGIVFVFLGIRGEYLLSFADRTFLVAQDVIPEELRSDIRTILAADPAPLDNTETPPGQSWTDPRTDRGYDHVGPRPEASKNDGTVSTSHNLRCAHCNEVLPSCNCSSPIDHSEGGVEGDTLCEECQTKANVSHWTEPGEVYYPLLDSHIPGSVAVKMDDWRQRIADLETENAELRCRTDFGDRYKAILLRLATEVACSSGSGTGHWSYESISKRAQKRSWELYRQERELRGEKESTLPASAFAGFDDLKPAVQPAATVPFREDLKTRTETFLAGWKTVEESEDEACRLLEEWMDRPENCVTLPTVERPDWTLDAEDDESVEDEEEPAPAPDPQSSLLERARFEIKQTRVMPGASELRLLRLLREWVQRASTPPRIQYPTPSFAPDDDEEEKREP